MTIKVVVIPWAREQPMEVKELDGSLSSFQGQVGGLIEVLAFTRDADFIVNEEGGYNLPINHRASSWFYEIARQPLSIFGSVVVAGCADENGNETSVPEWVITALRVN